MANRTRQLIDTLNEEDAKKLASGLLCLISAIEPGAFVEAWRFAKVAESTAREDLDFAMEFLSFKVAIVLGVRDGPEIPQA